MIELGLLRNWPSWMSQDPAFRPILDQDPDQGGPSSGARVNFSTAMNYSAVWSAVSVIAQAIASLPLSVYRSKADGSRERADRSPLFWLLHEEPNPEMTPLVFFETLMHHVLISGNFFVEVRRNDQGVPIALWPIDPVTVTPEREEPKGPIVYKQGAETLQQKNVIHVPGLGWDGVRGYSPISKARESIGLGLSTERFGGSFFGSGAWPGLVAESPKRMKDDVKKRLEGTLNDNHKGKPHRMIVLEDGMKLSRFSIIAPEDAQFLETRQFQVEEIARWFNIPLTKLKSKAGERPGGNIEAQNIEFVVDCLRPWLVRIEHEFNRKLIPVRERPGMYVEFNVEALLRGDAKSRAEVYKVYLDMGVITPEQIAAKENLPAPEERDAPISTRIENLGQLIRAGFEPESSLSALGLPPIKHTGQTPVTVKPDEEPDPEPAAAPPSDDEGARAALRSIILDTMDRMVRIESNEARRAAGSGRLKQWRDEFYPKHRARIAQALEPALRLAAPLASDFRERAAALADSMASRHSAELEGLAPPAVELATKRWETERPAEVAEAILGRA